MWMKYVSTFKKFGQTDSAPSELWFQELQEELKFLFKCKRTLTNLTKECSNALQECRKEAKLRKLSAADMAVIVLVEPFSNSTTGGKLDDNIMRESLLKTLSAFFPRYILLIICSALVNLVCADVLSSMLLALARLATDSTQTIGGNDCFPVLVPYALRTSSSLPDTVFIYESSLVFCTCGQYVMCNLLPLLTMEKGVELKRFLWSVGELVNKFELVAWKYSMDLRAALNSELVCASHTIFRCLQYAWCKKDDGSDKCPSLPVFDTPLVLHSLMEEASFHRLRQRGLAALSRISDALFIANSLYQRRTIFNGHMIHNDSIIDCEFDMSQRRIMEYCLSDGEISSLTLLTYLLDDFSGYEVGIRADTCSSIVSYSDIEISVDCPRFEHFGKMFDLAITCLGKVTLALPIVCFSLKRLNRLMEMEDTKLYRSRAAYAPPPRSLRKLYSWKKWKKACNYLRDEQLNHRLDYNNLKNLRTIPSFWRFAGTYGAADPMVILEVLRFSLTLYSMFSDDKSSLKPILMDAVKTACATINNAYEEPGKSGYDAWSEYCVVEYCARTTLRVCSEIFPLVVNDDASAKKSEREAVLVEEVQKHDDVRELLGSTIDRMTPHKAAGMSVELPAYIDILSDHVSLE